MQVFEESELALPIHLHSVLPETATVTYKTLMVHLELGHSNARLVQIAGDLTNRFHAGVIGIVGCQRMQIFYGEGYASADFLEQDCEEINREIKAAEAEFRSTLGARVRDLGWRSTMIFGSLADYLAREAHSADLVITGPAAGGLLDEARRADMSDLVMKVGRPILIVPAAADTLKLDCVIIGWKETRETRRAAADALPLLKRAAHVTVVEIAVENELTAARTRVKDVVVGWLKRHGIVADALVPTSSGDDASGLAAIAQEQHADLIVAGAYGHSRLREWALGGVTRDLLLRAESMLSRITLT